MDATDAMLYLDAVAHSIPEPVLPPKALDIQISEILRVTRPLLDTDHDWILQNIEVLQQQILVYDTLLNRIDAVRSKMQHHHDVVHRSMATYSSVLAPIHRLPSDILRTVFREVQVSRWWSRQEISEPSRELTALDFSQGPWLLSHVCGSWRDIILSFPQLWSHISLQFGTDHTAEDSELRDTIPTVQTMILRSAQHLLDIVFEVGYSEHEDLAIEVFPMILEESYRWRSLDLNLTLPLLKKWKAACGRIPCLESLTIEIYNPPSIEELPEDISSVFMDAPRLQRVVLHHGCGPSDFLIPLYITHLAVIMDGHPKIEAYQSLVECHLALQNSGHFASPPHPIHLPNVRRLFVSSLDLLPWLCLPSLADLTILNGPNLTYDMNVVIPMTNVCPPFSLHPYPPSHS